MGSLFEPCFSSVSIPNTSHLLKMHRAWNHIHQDLFFSVFEVNCFYGMQEDQLGVKHEMDVIDEFSLWVKGDVFFLAHVFCQLLLGQEITTKMPVMYHHQSHTKNPSRSHMHPGRERVPHPNKYLIHEQKNSGFSILLSSKWILTLFFVPEENVNQVQALIKTTINESSFQKKWNIKTTSYIII